MSETLAALVEREDAVLTYFSTPTCNVCKVLKPKVRQLLEADYPRVQFRYVDCEAEPATAGQQMVFAVPTIVLYFGGRETTRMSRNIGLGELAAAIDRPYHLLFD